MSKEIAKRYAKALFSIAKEVKKEVLIEKELSCFGSAFCEKEAKTFFSSPLASFEQKKIIIDQVLSKNKVSQEVGDLIKILLKKGRIAHIASIHEEYRNFLDADQGLTRGVVRAAKPLSGEAQLELEKKITTVLKKKIKLVFVEDAELLGGVVAQVGGWTFDDSVKTHLSNIKEMLIKN